MDEAVFCVLPKQVIVSVHFYKVHCTCTCQGFVSYRGWGALGFPTPSSAFPPQALMTLLYTIFPAQMGSGPPSACLTCKSNDLYETLHIHVCMYTPSPS